VCVLINPLIDIRLERRRIFVVRQREDDDTDAPGLNGLVATLKDKLLCCWLAIIGYAYDTYDDRVALDE